MTGQLGDQRSPDRRRRCRLATDWNGGTLHELNSQTGQAVVSQSTPSMQHFTTPSASAGKLLLATGQTVEAYTIANPALTTSAQAPTTTSAPAPIAAASCTLRLPSHRVRIHYPKEPKHRRHPPPAFGTVRLVANSARAPA